MEQGVRQQSEMLALYQARRYESDSQRLGDKVSQDFQVEDQNFPAPTTKNIVYLKINILPSILTENKRIM